jgi:hypothetical protein
MKTGYLRVLWLPEKRIIVDCHYQSIYGIVALFLHHAATNGGHRAHSWHVSVKNSDPDQTLEIQRTLDIDCKSLNYKFHKRFNSCVEDLPSIEEDDSHNPWIPS